MSHVTSSPRRRTIAALAFATLLAWPLAACADGGSDDSAYTGAPVTDAAAENGAAESGDTAAGQSDAAGSATASSSPGNAAESTTATDSDSDSDTDDDFSCATPVTHTNARYGFTVSLPCWAEPTESDNGDGLAVNRGPVQIQVYGTNSPRTIAEVKNELLAEASTQITYEHEASSSFRLSGYTGGRVFYVYQVSGTSSANVVSWYYPESQLETHRQAVEDSVHTFSPGDLDSPH